MSVLTLQNEKNKMDQIVPLVSDLRVIKMFVLK